MVIKTTSKQQQILKKNPQEIRLLFDGIPDGGVIQGNSDDPAVGRQRYKTEDSEMVNARKVLILLKRWSNLSIYDAVKKVDPSGWFTVQCTTSGRHQTGTTIKIQWSKPAPGSWTGSG